MNSPNPRRPVAVAIAAEAPADSEENLARKLGFFIFTFGMVILMISALSSCNTTRGFGRDVQHVGNNIERTAYRVQSGN